MFSERIYAFGTSTLTLRFGDILESTAEVLVSSDDFLLSMGGGVSRAISQAAGSALVLDAAKRVPRELADAADAAVSLAIDGELIVRLQRNLKRLRTISPGRMPHWP